MLRKAVYPKLEGLLSRAAVFCDRRGITPNQLTLAGAALNFLAGCIFAAGNFFLAGLVLLTAALGDLLDGPVARATGKASKFGAFLDSTADRYSDFFLFGGLALYYAGRGNLGWLALVLGILLGSFVTSYTKARAENLIADCSIGVFERAERVIALAVGAVFPSLMGLALWVLFLGTNATAVHRILFTKHALAGQAGSGPEAS